MIDSKIFCAALREGGFEQVHPDDGLWYKFNGSSRYLDKPPIGSNRYFDPDTFMVLDVSIQTVIEWNVVVGGQRQNAAMTFASFVRKHEGLLRRFH